MPTGVPCFMPNEEYKFCLLTDPEKCAQGIITGMRGKDHFHFEVVVQFSDPLNFGPIAYITFSQLALSWEFVRQSNAWRLFVMQPSWDLRVPSWNFNPGMSSSLLGRVDRNSPSAMRFAVYVQLQVAALSEGVGRYMPNKWKHPLVAR